MLMLEIVNLMAYIGTAACLNVYGQSQNANGLSLPETVATATAVGP